MVKQRRSERWARERQRENLTQFHGRPQPQLARPRHDGTEDVVDARRIALSIFPEPIVNVTIQAGSDQNLGRSAEAGQLLVGQRGNIRVVNRGIDAGGLTLRDSAQYRPLPLAQRLGEYRLGARADSPLARR